MALVSLGLLAVMVVPVQAATTFFGNNFDADALALNSAPAG